MELTQEQQLSLEESLKRGEAFEELINTRGWGYVKVYYTAKVQQFASSLLVSEKKGIEEFEAERRELIGLRKLLGMIDSDIEVYRKQYGTTKPTADK